MTYTYVAMKVSHDTFKEIEAKLRRAGYEGQIHDDGKTLDMHDIALVEDDANPLDLYVCPGCYAVREHRPLCDECRAKAPAP